MSELESSFPTQSKREGESDGERDREEGREREKVGRINILRGEVQRSRGAVGLK